MGSAFVGVRGEIRRACSGTPRRGPDGVVLETPSHLWVETEKYGEATRPTGENFLEIPPGSDSGL
jgi:hypothetical protein